MTIYLTFALIFSASIAKAFMDISAKDGFHEAWFNKTQSWENKYAIPLVKGTDWWYFGIYKTIYKERFPFSSTFFVCFTDGWHMFQFIFLNCIFIALALNMSSSIIGMTLSFVSLRVIFGIGFNVFYK